MKIIIINSKDHWRNGWFSSPDELETVIQLLSKAKIEVSTVEVESVDELTKTLASITADTLVWPNAYYVNHGTDKIVWLNDYVEDAGLPFLGSTSPTLQRLLQKDACQLFLQEKGFPIPKFTIIDTSDAQAIEQALLRGKFNYPLVIKPTAESGSVGVCLAKSLSEAVQQVQQTLETYVHSKVIVEAFLPSDDITCGYFSLGDQVLLLPTYYMVKSVPGKSNILNRTQRLRAWDDQDKIQPCVTDSSILDQLKTTVPAIAHALDVRGVTRIDGRLDQDKQIRFFDVNGLPALSFPDSVIVKQCFSCFPDYPQQEVFEALIHTLVYQALLKFEMEVPEIMKQHNLFTLESKYVIRLTASVME